MWWERGDTEPHTRAHKGEHSWGLIIPSCRTQQMMQFSVPLNNGRKLYPFVRAPILQTESTSSGEKALKLIPM